MRSIGIALLLREQTYLSPTSCTMSTEHLQLPDKYISPSLSTVQNHSSTVHTHLQYHFKSHATLLPPSQYNQTIPHSARSKSSVRCTSLLPNAVQCWRASVEVTAHRHFSDSTRKVITTAGPCFVKSPFSCSGGRQWESPWAWSNLTWTP